MVSARSASMAPVWPAGSRIWPAISATRAAPPAPLRGTAAVQAFCGETETHLVRIAQEAVRNAFAHGRADRIEISLEYADGSGLLIIRDNGLGISEDGRRRDGIGLHTMDYR